ncbi:MAG: hypothetical protein ACKVQB_03785 [Bacteroidia bacterium]
MQIEPEALFGLFDTLILPSEKPVKTEKQIIEPSSSKKMLMLFDKPNPSDAIDFLNKILAAIKLGPEDVESKFEINSELLPEIIKNHSGYLLVWGIEISINPEVAFAKQKYKLHKIGETSLIVCDSLSVVKNDLALKGKLWNCLKEEFVK